MTIDYYQRNAKKFVEGTIDVDVSELQSKFLQLLQSEAHILDAGCGSGRDTKFFIENGYKVTSIDASSELVKIASEYSGIAVQCMKFEDIEFKDEFDGIWACASLLHIGKTNLPAILMKFTESLKKSGILYVSFKYGELERVDAGRLFNDQNEKSFSVIIEDLSDLSIVEMWKTADLRPNRDNEYWLNCLVRKNEQ